MDVHLSVSPLNGAGMRSLAKQALRLGGALVLLLCAAVAIRGLLGSFRAPDQTAFLLLAAVAVELLASLYRIAWQHLDSAEAGSSGRLAQWMLPSVGVLCIGVALSMTGSSVWSIGLVWLIIAGGEAAWWRSELQSVWQLPTRSRNTPTTDFGESLVDDCSDDDFVDEEELDPSITQQITRSRNDDGTEVVSGILRAEFVSGQQNQNLHIAFCPPLDYTPQIIAHQLDGSPLVIKVAQAEVFGARIELRLAAVARTDERATICFEAQPRDGNA